MARKSMFHLVLSAYWHFHVDVAHIEHMILWHYLQSFVWHTEFNQNQGNPELLCTLNLNLFYCFLIMSPYLFRCLTKNSNAEVVIHTYKPVCVELYKDYKDIGRFMLRYSGEQ